MTTRNISASCQPSNLCWWSAHILFTSSHPLYTLHCSILANSMCWCCTRLDCHWTNFLNLILSDLINSLTPSSLWQEQHGLSTPGTLPAHFFAQQFSTIVVHLASRHFFLQCAGQAASRAELLRRHQGVRQAFPDFRLGPRNSLDEAGLWQWEV